jgi:putative transposase
MKPGTFTQLHVQLVFAVKSRENILTAEIRPRIFEYVSGIVSSMKHKSIIVNGFNDHIHVFLGLNPNVSISDTVHDIKRSSSIFINEILLLKNHFNWQEGYGAFSYSRSQVKTIYQYILNQEIHHSEKSFKEEYLNLLDENEIEYDSRFLFEFFG